MNKEFDRIVFCARVWVTCIIVSVVAFVAEMCFLLPNVSPERTFPIVAVTVLLFWVSLLVYLSKYRGCITCHKILKRGYREGLMDGINIFNDEYEIQCGVKAFFTRKPYLLVPYDEVVWIHENKQDASFISVHLKNGKTVNVKTTSPDQFVKFAGYLKRNNPLIETMEHGEKNLRKSKPELFAPEQKKKGTAGLIVIGVSLLLCIVGIVNKTLDVSLGIFLLIIFIVGLSLFLYAKFYFGIRNFLDNILSVMRNSVWVNRICKISVPVYLVSMFGFIIICGVFRWDWPLPIFLTGIGVSVVPFFASFCLGLGDYVPVPPVKVEGQIININSHALMEWRKKNLDAREWEGNFVIPLKGKEPVIGLYDDGMRTVSYCLQTEGNENFDGKYFHISVRLVSLQGCIPAAQIDGFISDTSEERSMTKDDIGYRMEGYFLRRGGRAAERLYDETRDRDLPAKGLKYPGYTTPANVRLIGVCPRCKESFAFHGYAFYMMQNDVAYSDDGQYCCSVTPYKLPQDKKELSEWKYETDGKTFRYYNSFNCPHCGMPYIDYKTHPEEKVFGVSGCVHLGSKYYDVE